MRKFRRHDEAHSSLQPARARARATSPLLLSVPQRDEGRWEPQTISGTEAIDQAAAMVERFNAMFLRTLKALRDLRRQVPGVMVQNATQVNVGQQQVNVATEDG